MALVHSVLQLQGTGAVQVDSIKWRDGLFVHMVSSTCVYPAELKLFFLKSWSKIISFLLTSFYCYVELQSSLFLVCLKQHQQ